MPRPIRRKTERPVSFQLSLFRSHPTSVDNSCRAGLLACGSVHDACLPGVPVALVAPHSPHTVAGAAAALDLLFGSTLSAFPVSSPARFAHIGNLAAVFVRAPSQGVKDDSDLSKRRSGGAIDLSTVFVGILIKLAQYLVDNRLCCGICGKPALTRASSAPHALGNQESSRTGSRAFFETATQWLQKLC